MATTLPQGALATGLVNNPRSHRDDLATRLERGDEVIWLHYSTLRLRPTQQRLDTGEGTRCEFDGRLIHQEELMALERAAQIHFERAVTVDRLLH